MKEKEKAEYLIKKHLTAIVEESMDSDKMMLYSAKQCALIDIQNSIDLLQSIINESVNVHQSLSTPKKLCIDLLNPKLKELYNIKFELENYEIK